MADRRAARALAAGLAPPWPRIRTVIADAGYGSGALAQHLDEQAGWELRRDGRTPAQEALRALLDRAPNVVVIPGTTSIAHLEENMRA